jgi:hypothetical protein
MEVPALQIPQREKLHQIGVVVAKVFGTGRFQTARTALAKVAPQIEDARAVIGRFGRT